MSTEIPLLLHALLKGGKIENTKNRSYPRASAQLNVLHTQALCSRFFTNATGTGTVSYLLNKKPQPSLFGAAIPQKHKEGGRNKN